jgi:acylphosphatase
VLFGRLVNAAMEVAKLYLISGRVQGVGYRFFAEKEGNRLGVRGYVRNLSTGTVEVYAIGNPAVLDQFKRRLAKGPLGARVHRIEESDEDVEDLYSRFVIGTSG